MSISCSETMLGQIASLPQPRPVSIARSNICRLFKPATCGNSSHASLFAMNTNSGLLPASKEIRRWCSILEQELLQLSGVKMTHVFGTRAFYHRKVMFAMLPHKRTLEGSAVISFIRTENNSEPNWQTFELTGHNLDDAMVLLEQAYRLSVLRPFTGFRRLRASVYSAIKIGNRESMYAVR